MLKSRLKHVMRELLYAIPSSYVLMFHHVTDKPLIKRSGCLIETNCFKEIIDLNTNYASVNNVIDHPSRRNIAITFDDGLLDLYSVAYPYLGEKGIPFTAFVVTDFLDKEGYITRKQLLEMSKDPLVTIGSHGISHKVLKFLSAEEKKTELLISKNIIEEIIGKEVSLFAYSHGQYDQDVLRYAKAYSAGLSTIARPLNILTGMNKYTIPRYNIDSTTYEKQKEFLSKVKLG